ncbi:glutathione peroxidase [Penaeus vannamei]|uniref:glutathione peroxidase n=1 Tax=Penaeus vannamei TaxID=6689 RepID=A0A3R7NSJ7_PENVA|nr:glutathione peroxidase [Penaeus vannamei]
MVILILTGAVGSGVVQEVPGEGGAGAEHGVALRDDHQGLPPDEPTQGRVRRQAGGPGLPLQPVRAPGGSFVLFHVNLFLFFLFLLLLLSFAFPCNQFGHQVGRSSFFSLLFSFFSSCSYSSSPLLSFAFPCNQFGHQFGHQFEHQVGHSSFFSCYSPSFPPPVISSSPATSSGTSHQFEHQFGHQVFFSLFPLLLVEEAGQLRGASSLPPLFVHTIITSPRLPFLQENTTDAEMLVSLRHVRPGNCFEPKMEIFSKVEVNGSNCHPVFQYLKEALPIPFDDPESFMSDPKFILWSPVCRSDVAWNFEKFLVGRDGKPFRRYSRRFETKTIAEDIAKLLVWPKTPVPISSSAFRDLP